MKRILGFATYPIKFPVHGGQRRVSAFADFYRNLGMEYDCVCVYERPIYAPNKVGPYDLPLGYGGGELAGIPFIGDLLSGIFASADERAFDHFLNVVRQRKPSALVLEQPFMWPLIKRLREDPEIRKIPLIYSSQNWEAVLKHKILIQHGVERDVARKIATQIEDLERSVVNASRIVFAVSESDASMYRDIAPQKAILVVGNGVARPSRNAPDPRSVSLREFRDSRYLFFVGSAYPPNVDGVCDLFLDGGLFFLPPQPSVAICGGAAHQIFADRRYQRFSHSNSRRARFFPDVSDNELEALKTRAHAVLLPINFGGGSNLKTAEALASGKWVVATSTAMRGFEAFKTQPGVLVADSGADFRQSVIKVYNSDPLQLSDDEKRARESVYWDRCFGQLSLRDLDLFGDPPVGRALRPA